MSKLNILNTVDKSERIFWENIIFLYIMNVVDFVEYTVDEEQSVVEHARISHSNPAMWNEVVRRKFTFKGDTLILQPLEEATSGLRLKWIRGSASNKK